MYEYEKHLFKVGDRVLLKDTVGTSFQEPRHGTVLFVVHKKGYVSHLEVVFDHDKKRRLAVYRFEKVKMLRRIRI